MHPLASLVQFFSQMKDPRKPRGVRHPVQGILTLVFLGLLGRIREMQVLVRWAKLNWDELREPLGFLRAEPPHATTISRTLARCDLSQFSSAFVAWAKQVAPEEGHEEAKSRGDEHLIPCAQYERLYRAVYPNDSA